MTVKAILDTDILSEYLKGHNAAVAGRAAGYDYLAVATIKATARKQGSVVELDCVDCSAIELPPRNRKY